MPELPEVERGRTIAEGVAKGRAIVTVRVQADDIVMPEGPRRVARALRGAQVVAVRRHGKQLWFELDRRPWPLFHFGMTGEFVDPAAQRLQLESGPTVSTKSEEAWPPRFWKIQMEFEDGGKLAMTNARRLGRIRLREDPTSEEPIASLGFDPLTSLPSAREFRDLVRRRKAQLKGMLLDQAFAAGVGNWIADEVLYQARLDPRRRADELDDGEIGRLRRALAKVVQTAVDANADKAKFPRSWLFHQRWGKNEYAQVAGQPVEFLTVAGRTTAWVPARQG